MYVLKISGIPYMFIEKRPLRVDNAAAPSATPTITGAYTYTTVEGLTIDSSPTISNEIDRQTGIGKGSGIDFRIAMSELIASGANTIFTKPSKKGDLVSDLSGTATAITVTDETWGSSGTVFLGLECVAFTSNSPSGSYRSLGGLTRGLAGEVHAHKASSFTSYRWVTDRPVLWRGRTVTLGEHILSPEGRILDSTYGSGTYYREIYRGYIEAPPRNAGAFMELKTLPLVRKLSQQMGYTGVFDIANHMEFNAGTPFTNFPLWFGDNEEHLQVSVQYTVTSGGAKNTISAAVIPDNTGGSTSGSNYVNWVYNDSFVWVGSVDSEINDVFGSAIFTADVVAPRESFVNPSDDILFRFGPASGKTLDACSVEIFHDHNPWFLEPGIYHGYASGHAGYPIYVKVPIRTSLANGEKPWLMLHNPSGQGAYDAEVPSAGVGVISDGETSELVEWLTTDTAPRGSDASGGSGSEYIGVRISQRALDNGSACELVNRPDLKFKTACGHAGALNKTIYTLLQSSGSGQRGTYDTLAIGFGAGIDDGHIDSTSIDALRFANRSVVACNEGRQSFSALLGGWIVGSGSCLCMKRVGGVMKIAAVDYRTGSAATLDPAVVEINAEDVLLSKIRPVATIDMPNEIHFETKTANKDAPTITVRDIPRVQAEGITSWSLNCPSMDVDDCISVGEEIIAATDGVGVITVPVGLWVDIQVGDTAVLNTAHPATYDWSRGAVAPPELVGRVLSVKRNLVSSRQDIKIALAGNIQEPYILAPTLVTTAANASAKTITIAAGDTAWFRVDDVVAIYEQGNETAGTPLLEERTIATINATTGVITFTVAPSFAETSIAASKVVYLTYPVKTNATTEQKEYMYEDADWHWGSS